MSLPLNIRHLGRRAYQPVWEAMSAFTDARAEDTCDELWLLEHEAVFTLGQAGKLEHVLDAGNIPLLKVDRGGQVTYHGPGQLIAYPLLDLRRLKLGVRELVCKIEQSVIDVLAQWDIRAVRHAGAPGVYVNEAKIAALGLKVRRGCCFHGLSLNVEMDLSPFSRINPCGYRGLAVTQMLDWAAPARVADVGAAWLASFCRQFDFHPQPVQDRLPAPTAALRRA